MLESNLNSEILYLNNRKGGLSMLISLVMGFMSAVLAGVLTRRIWLSISIFVFIFLATYNGLPTLAFGFPGPPALLLLTGCICLVVELIYFELSRDGYHRDLDKVAKSRKRLIPPGIAVIITLLFIVFVIPMSSWAFFHHTEYRDLIGEVKESTFSTDTSPIDPTQVRVVDQLLARRLAEKKIGEDPGLGSQVKLGNMYIQTVKGRLYWVGALRHAGFFRWYANRRGTSGYIKVSATDSRDITLVRSIGGKDLEIRYNKGAWFGDFPARYLYENGYATVGYDDWTFEIDDEGNPYYVVTRYDKKIGFFGADASGVIVLNVQNGDIDDYDIDEAPKWIDRIQPASFVISQLDCWGTYVHGWWWNNLSNKDKLQTTQGMSLVYGNSGESYWYTGMSSIGEDESTVGFMLVNTRTKEARLYKQAGATETSAVGSAQGMVQEKEYSATFPIMYNVSGLPTYFTTLKDNAGLVKQMAFVSVENYQLVGVGDNVQSALNAYRRVISSKGNAIASDTSVTQQSASGTVLRIGSEVNSGNTYFYLILEGHENKQFVCSSDISTEVVNTLIGDEAVISFDDGGNRTVYAQSFDNLGLDLQETEDQAVVEGRVEEVRQLQKSGQAETNVDAKWEGLSAEEKEALMEK
jgi:hypothetical protein